MSIGLNVFLRSGSSVSLTDEIWVIGVWGFVGVFSKSTFSSEVKSALSNVPVTDNSVSSEFSSILSPID